jgi:hypothetical protein
MLARCKLTAEVPVREKRITVTASNPVNINPVDGCSRRRSAPAAAEEIHFMTQGGNPSKDLMQMKLGASGLWILAVQPVEYEDAH